MPFSEFQNGNAGLALPTFQLQSQDAFASLMERAQRMKISQEDFKLKQESHAANLVTSALQQDQYRADISIKQATLRETERSTRELADIRSAYSQLAPTIDQSLKAIQDNIDPYEQRRMMAQLVAKTSRFSQDPNLKGILDRQMDATAKLIDANEASKVSEHRETNQYATDEATARAKFPGQGLRVVTRPGPNPGSPPVTFYLPTGKPDPQKEATALGWLAMARDEKELNEVLARPEVNEMFQVPASAVREAFKNRRDLFTKETQAADEIGVKRQTANAANAPKPIPVTLLESTEKMKRAYNDLQGIKDTFDTDPNMKGPFVGFVREFNPYDLSAQELRARITAAVPNLARGVFGEVGVLTDADIANYKRLLPTTRNTDEAAEILFQFLSKKLETVYDDRLVVLEKQGYNTAGFQKNKKPRTAVNGSAAQRIINGGTPVK
jgi:hypothetical protein